MSVSKTGSAICPLNDNELQYNMLHAMCVHNLSLHTMYFYSFFASTLAYMVSWK